MAKPDIQTGAHSTLIYYWEDGGFKSDPSDSTPKAFGKESRLTTFDGSRNAVELFDPGDREVAQFIEQEFSGTFTVDFVFTNPWWLQSVVDTPSTSGSSAPYEHDFGGQEPSSIQLVTGNTKSGRDYLLRGGVVQSADVSINVPGNIEVSLSGAYASLEPTTPSTQESQVDFGHDVFTFADASMDIAGTTQRLLQSIDLSIENNTDMVLEIGDQEPVDFSPKGRQLTVDAVQTRSSSEDEAIDRFLGSSTGLERRAERNEIVINIDNDGTDADKQSVEFTLADAMDNDVSPSNIGDPDSDVENSFTQRPTNLGVVAENDTEMAP
jgi:hypothetical protein